MSEFNTLQYFPKNRKNENLYQFFSTVFDEGLNKFFSSYYNTNKNIFNPNSDYYDADYILSITLGKDISKLFLNQPYEVRKSLSLIYPGLIKIRGTELAITTFLKLINIRFSKIVYIKQRNGCTNATIVLEPGTILDSETQLLLIEIMKRLLPICVRLSGLTNCDHGNGNDWDSDVGEHLLSRNFRLSISRLSRSQGVPNENGLIINNCKLK